MTIFFTGDHHFHHANIITYAERNFSNVLEMDEELIRAWNNTVSIQDTVYYLGDFCLGVSPQDIFVELNGTIWYLADETHHDRKWLYKELHDSRRIFSSENYFTKSGAVHFMPSLVTLDMEPAITLCHFPIESWNKSHYGAWSLHGHIHSRGDSFRKEKKLDVGVDNAKVLLGEYRPFSLEEVTEIMQTR